MLQVNLSDILTFHSMDRQVFSRLVMTCTRDPAESLLAMALWLWLEQEWYPDIVVRLADLSEDLVSTAADEAIVILDRLTDAPISPRYEIPLTSELMGTDQYVSLRMFLFNRHTMIIGIKSFLTGVCSRIFTDILERTMDCRRQVILNQPLPIVGLSHPLFGDVDIYPRPTTGYDLPTGGDVWEWQPMGDVDEKDRTVFLTFSRGCPVTEDEVMDVFEKAYGEDCVRSLTMQRPGSCDKQVLYAKMIVGSIEHVDRILQGNRVAKYRVNDKHIWARKYDRRD